MSENVRWKKTMLVDLPVEVLWSYREFKRDEVSAPNIPYAQNHTADEVTVYVESKGKIEPLELSIIGSSAFLTDGNHRLVAAKRLGYTTVQVNVMVFFGERTETFYEHTLKRFKPISKELGFLLKKTIL